MKITREERGAWDQFFAAFVSGTSDIEVAALRADSCILKRREREIVPSLGETLGGAHVAIERAMVQSQLLRPAHVGNESEVEAFRAWESLHDALRDALCVIRAAAAGDPRTT
jgi:hypothetical protein